MAERDSSTIKLKYPDLDYDGDGSVDGGSAFYPCIVGGPNWSGFKKTPVSTLCSNSTLDDWGNLIKSFRSGKILDLGTITLEIQWDPNLVSSEESLILAAFYDGTEGDYLIEIPAEGAETTGPVITIPAIQEGFTPMGEVLVEGDQARLRASVVLRIAGAITVAAAAGS